MSSRLDYLLFLLISLYGFMIITTGMPTESINGTQPTVNSTENKNKTDAEPDWENLTASEWKQMIDEMIMMANEIKSNHSESIYEIIPSPGLVITDSINNTMDGWDRMISNLGL